MEILDSGRLVGVEPVPATSDQESGELVLAPGEYVDVEVRVPPPNLTRYVAPAFDQIHSDGHQLLLSFFANAEYYLRAQGHKATGETWHKRLGHPSQSTLNNTTKAEVLDKNSLLLPNGLELKPVNRPAPCTICTAAKPPHEPFPTHFPGADDYQLMDKVYSDILNLPEDGFNGERYVITFTDASTRNVWTGNMTNRFLAFTAFRTWLPLAERESDTKLKSFQCDGAGEYRSTEFTTYLQERGIRRLFSLPHAHQQSGVAERLNRTLQEKMRALLAQAQLGPLYWPLAMDHATLLHNMLSSSALPNNASPHLLWTGKLGTTKLLRVFGCVVQYRPPTAPLGKFDQRAKWGLHLGIEKQYIALRIMDYRSRLLVPARDCIFYENLTLPVFEQHLASQQNPATLFHGVRSFANADVEIAASEEPDSDGAREAAPDPPVPVASSGIPELIPLADAAPEDVRKVHHTYLVDEQRQPMPVVSDSSIRVNLDEIGGASGDQNNYFNFAGRTDDNPHYQTGLQILGLAAAVQYSSTVNLEPKTARQALSGPHREKWREAMDRELAALEKRGTCDLIPIENTVNKNVLTCTWDFRAKTKADGTYEKHKARWVVRGFDQTHRIDYTLTFAPIDVSNAFLYADVDAEIYVEYRHTYPTNPPSVCKLKKSLYGIKQAPRLWQQHLNRKLTEVGFRQLPHDPRTYRLDDKGSYALLMAYVDDILYVNSSTSLGDRIEADLKKSLDLTISTKVTQFLGLNVSRTSSAIHLTASKYAESLAKRFNISTDFVATPYPSTPTGHVPDLKILSAAGLQLYQQQLGCLLFAADTCRPDLAYIASHLAQFLRCPKEEHSLDLQRALRYFVSTPTLGLIFNAGKPTDKMYLSGYVDADHAADTSDRRSRTGYIFRLEPIGLISWNSSKQELVSLSSAEAEFIAACAATREGLFLHELLDEAKFVTPNQFTLQCDNQSAITIANKPGFVNRTKHISLRYFFVKDAIDKGRMRLYNFLAWQPARGDLAAPPTWLHRAPREGNNTLAALGFTPSTADPPLFLHTDTSLPPFYDLVYVDNLVFPTADTEALTLVKSELQKRHTCTDLGELRSYLGLQITRDRAWRTITITQSHMVHHILQRFGFQFSSPQPTPMSTGHSLSAPPSDESVEPSGPYLELVGWLISSCEAEIYAGAMAAQELHWLTYLLTDLGEQPRSPPILMKHIALRYFLSQELQQRGQLHLAYVATRANTADIFTKALPPGDH
ncbi:unnamed protein product [Closterium sp. NIES-53]